MAREIPLTKGKVTVVDDELFEYLSQWSWSYHNRGYARRGTAVDGKFTNVMMHRLIMNAPDGLEVDHINGDPLDNRRCNLRICTRAENARNGPSRRGSTSSFKGVTWNRRSKRWLAAICVNGERHRLGRFATELEAAKAYDRAARELHGEFARLNLSA